MTNDERLSRIKEILINTDLINAAGDPHMELNDEVMKFWEEAHIDWLLVQAEELVKAKKVILRQYRYAGMSAEIDLGLWKEIENYLGGKESARAALDDNT